MISCGNRAKRGVWLGKRCSHGMGICFSDASWSSLELFLDSPGVLDMGRSSKGRDSTDVCVFLAIRYAWFDKSGAVNDPSVIWVEFEVPKRTAFAFIKLHRLIESQKLATENCWSIRPGSLRASDSLAPLYCSCQDYLVNPDGLRAKRKPKPPSRTDG